MEFSKEDIWFVYAKTGYLQIPLKRSGAMKLWLQIWMQGVVLSCLWGLMLCLQWVTSVHIIHRYVQWICLHCIRSCSLRHFQVFCQMLIIDYSNSSTNNLTNTMEIIPITTTNVTTLQNTMHQVSFCLRISTLTHWSNSIFTPCFGVMFFQFKPTHWQ